MALTFRLDPAQVEQITKLTSAVAKLTEIVSDLVLVLGGTDSETVQQRIDEIASTVKTTKDKLQQSVDSQNKGD